MDKGSPGMHCQEVSWARVAACRVAEIRCLVRVRFAHPTLASRSGRARVDAKHYSDSWSNVASVFFAAQIGLGGNIYAALLACVVTMKHAHACER